jgi:hypothetical protein
MQMLQQSIIDMNTDQFRTVGVNHVESVLGFSVRRKDRNSLLYIGAGFPLEIEVEPGESLGVYLTHSAKAQDVSDQEIQTIRNNLGAALHFMNVKFEII